MLRNILNIGHSSEDQTVHMPLLVLNLILSADRFVQIGLFSKCSMGLLLSIFAAATVVSPS